MATFGCAQKRTSIYGWWRQEAICLLFFLLCEVATSFSLLSHGSNYVFQSNCPCTAYSTSGKVPPFQLSVAASEDISTIDAEVSSRQEEFRAAKASYISQIEESLQDGTFVSLLLRGPPKKKKKKSKTSSNNPIEDEMLRGRFRQIQFRRIQIKGKEFLQVTFKYHLATDIAKNWPLEDMARVVESLRTILDPTGSKNAVLDDNYIPVSEWGRMEADEQATMLGIQSASLTTSQLVVDLDVGYKARKPRLKTTKAKAATNTAAITPAGHDRTKKVPLDTKSDFLQALGVTDSKGKPKRAMASKLRQCQKFVEIVGNLVDRASVKKSQSISVLDMGCGRGYLTFSLHSYLTQKHGSASVQSVGIDVRPKLVQEINGIATSLGPGFEGLTFEEGSIEDVMLHNSQYNEVDDNKSSLDILIALHACDTATDDAIWCGISRRADIIVVAPCCHKQVRPQLNAHVSSSKNHPLADILRHNVYRERHAEMVTDSLRALLLELAGYQVQVFEFIGGEHTAKNVQITAVRTGKPAAREKVQQKLNELAALHGIRQQKLAQWMGEDLGGQPQSINPKRMPPL